MVGVNEKIRVVSAKTALLPVDLSMSRHMRIKEGHFSNKIAH
jgi:hypothetical protein